MVTPRRRLLDVLTSAICTSPLIWLRTRSRTSSLRYRQPRVRTAQKRRTDGARHEQYGNRDQHRTNQTPEHQNACPIEMWN